jgi:hypothetical protein
MISRHDVVAVQDVKDAATYLLKDKPDWKCTSCVAVSVSVPSAVVVSEESSQAMNLAALVLLLAP